MILAAIRGPAGVKRKLTLIGTSEMHKSLTSRCPCGAHLELQLHAGHVLSWLDLRQPLDVRVKVPGRDFGVPAGHSLQQRVMNEDVLVLRLDHVVPLGAHQRDVAVHVHRLLLLDPLGHGVDDNEATGATNSSAVPKRRREEKRKGIK